mgnify:CR=1 FL=1
MPKDCLKAGAKLRERSAFLLFCLFVPSVGKPSDEDKAKDSIGGQEEVHPPCLTMKVGLKTPTKVHSNGMGNERKITYINKDRNES